MCALLLHSFGSALGIDKVSTSHCNLETLPQRAALSYNISLRPPLSLHPPHHGSFLLHPLHRSFPCEILFNPCQTLLQRKTCRCHLRSRVPYIRLPWSTVQLWPAVLSFTSLPKSTLVFSKCDINTDVHLPLLLLATERKGQTIPMIFFIFNISGLTISVFCKSVPLSQPNHCCIRKCKHFFLVWQILKWFTYAGLMTFRISLLPFSPASSWNCLKKKKKDGTATSDEKLARIKDLFLLFQVFPLFCARRIILQASPLFLFHCQIDPERFKQSL